MDKNSQHQVFQMCGVPCAPFVPISSHGEAPEPEKSQPQCRTSKMASGVAYPGFLEESSLYPNLVVCIEQEAQPPEVQIQMGGGCEGTAEQVLATQEKLSVHSNKKAGEKDARTVEIRDAQNELVMTAVSTTAVPSAGEDNIETITFDDAVGKHLMTCTQSTDSQKCTVTVEDRVVGVIDVDGKTFAAAGSNGDHLFETVKRAGEIAFVCNGTEIAVAKKGVINGDKLGLFLEFSPSLDADTKAVILVVSYCMYKLHKRAQFSWTCVWSAVIFFHFFLLY